MYKVYFIKYYQYFSNLYFEQLLFFRNFFLYIAVYFIFFLKEKSIWEFVIILHSDVVEMLELFLFTDD